MSGQRWVLCLAREEATSLGPLRLERGVEACAREGTLWVRGPLETPRPGDVFPSALLCVPAAGRFRSQADGKLRPWGDALSVGELPDGPWLPLQRVLAVAPPAPAAAGQSGPPAPLRLVPATSPRDETLLLTDATSFNAWALQAPELRLERLAVAYDASGRVLIRGAPLPPLPGRRLWEDGGVAVPCGLRWDPQVSAAVLSELFDLLPGELILLSADSHERLSSASFVPASRAMARSSPGEAEP